jgi:hypothetical protein
MKVIIAGSRSICDRELVRKAIADSRFHVTEVVCGGAAGVDAIGQDWAWERFLPVRVFPADWSQHGKAAGMIRNQQMATYADALIAVWDGESPGTQHMIEFARKAKRKVYVYVLTPSSSEPPFD